MSNFRMKSQDMYFEDPEKYAHFKEVFDTIRHMSISKNYYEANLFNIEEILPIQEMGEYLEVRNLKDPFLKYIADGIEYYTPEIPAHTDEHIRHASSADGIFRCGKSCESAPGR